MPPVTQCVVPGCGGTDFVHARNGRSSQPSRNHAGLASMVVIAVAVGAAAEAPALTFSPRGAWLIATPHIWAQAGSPRPAVAGARVTAQAARAVVVAEIVVLKVAVEAAALILIFLPVSDTVCPPNPPPSHERTGLGGTWTRDGRVLVCAAGFTPELNP